MTPDPAIHGGRWQRRRRTPDHPWPMAQALQPWDAAEMAYLCSAWHDLSLTIEDIARTLQRGVKSVRVRANKLRLGVRGAPNPPPTTMPVKRRRPEPPVRLKPATDGVVLTPRLDTAWSRVEAGEDVMAVAMDLRCPAAEVAALRRWSAAA